jgi:hypothetical protein
VKVVSDPPLRKLEAESIYAFVESCAPLLDGKVLDYGAGRKPYREIVERAGGDYTAWDRMSLPGSVADADVGMSRPLRLDWDAIICTQVIQYVPDPAHMLGWTREALRTKGGALILTGPLTWPEVEREDLQRFTRAGIRRLLEGCGYRIERLEPRGRLDLRGVAELHLGWQAVASA